MNPFADQTSAEVAEEAENERAGLVNTLDQLRENLRPENMVDEMFSQAQANTSDVMDRVWGLARANPIPAALIGIGIAMLTSAGQRFRRKTPRAGLWPDYESGTERSSALHDFDTTDASARPLWAAESHEPTGSAMDSYSIRPRTGLARLLDEQPLILAALGVAVGAAVGSALPSTEVEAQWMGDASESVRRNANAMAREQLSQIRTTASQTLDQMKATAAEHGVSAENVSGLVHDLGENVRSAALAAGDRGSASATH